MLTHSYIGNTIEIEIDIVDYSGLPLDLTGCDLVFTASTTNGDFSIEKTDIDGVDVIEETVGRVRVTIDPGDTSTLTIARNLWWDLVMTDTFMDVRTVAHGRIALSLPVSAMVFA